MSAASALQTIMSRGPVSVTTGSSHKHTAKAEPLVRTAANLLGTTGTAPQDCTAHFLHVILKCDSALGPRQALSQHAALHHASVGAALASCKAFSVVAMHQYCPAPVPMQKRPQQVAPLFAGAKHSPVQGKPSQHSTGQHWYLTMQPHLLHGVPFCDSISVILLGNKEGHLKQSVLLVAPSIIVGELQHDVITPFLNLQIE